MSSINLKKNLFEIPLKNSVSGTARAVIFGTFFASAPAAPQRSAQLWGNRAHH
jgi:hypothetical protein